MNEKFEQFSNAVRIPILLLSIVVACAIVWATYNLLHKTSEKHIPTSTRTFEFPSPEPGDPEHWNIFQSSAPEKPASATDNQDRFRLVGTFFSYKDDADREPSRVAILDETETGAQLMVNEGDKLPGATMMRILEDRVVIRMGARDVIIKISYSGQPDKEMTESTSTNKTVAPYSTLDDFPALETSRFGKRISTNRWVMQKSELLNYYQDLLDDPERLASLYLSMKGDYNTDRKIQGYRLQAEGEQEFFKAAGLSEGDVIRSVNSMKMTSQKRAEYFISEFVQDRVSALVFEVDRGGSTNKLIYFIR